MNAFDTLKAGAAGLAEKVTGEDPKLLQEATKLVHAMPGGIPGLVKQFKDNGLGEIVASWMGKGPKLSITPQQILQGFGSERIHSLASTTGLDSKVVQEKLATILPKIVVGPSII
jgi:uncharacterized protein YidB (DUF937 family)